VSICEVGGQSKYDKLHPLPTLRTDFVGNASLHAGEERHHFQASLMIALIYSIVFESERITALQ